MLLLVDANVLIDYVSVDRTVLSAMVRHFGAIHVPRDVLGEVEQLDEDACRELGLSVVDGTFEQIEEAGARRGALSFADRVCLILARDNGWVCVSNDGPLRGACTAEGVQVMWGLQLMLEMVTAGAMEASAAISVAEAIGEGNAWITPRVVAGFREKALGIVVKTGG